MADRVVPGPVESTARVREAVCIRTRKIFDSCIWCTALQIHRTQCTVCPVAFAGQPPIIAM